MRRSLVPVILLAVVVAGCGLAYEEVGTTTTTTTLAPPASIPTGPADIVFTDQRVEGTFVTVDSVSMPAPGFVVLRVDEGGVPGEIIGIGDVLVRGVVANVEVPLFVPLTDAVLVHAGLHVDMDEDGVFTYEPPDDVVDVPATSANGSEATASALVELLPPLGPVALVFEDQRSDGDAVTVALATLPARGFVSVWTSDEGSPDVVLGHSALLPEGTAEDLQIRLDTPVLESAPLIAAVHIDRDENGTFVPGEDFDPLGESVDGLPAFTTGFITVVRIEPVAISAEDQEVDDGASVVIASAVLPAHGFVEVVRGGEVIAASDLLEAGETTGLVIELDEPLEPGEYGVAVRVLIDFDDDGVRTDLDPVGLDADGERARAAFTVTVPEPPDEDA